MLILKNRIRLINDIFQNQETLEELCTLSCNNSVFVCENIIKIIKYYLYSPKISKDLHEIVETPITTNEKYKFYGLNTNISNKFPKTDHKKLLKNSDFITYIKLVNRNLNIPNMDDTVHEKNTIEEAFENAQTYPLSFYEGTIKNVELPIIYGENESSYLTNKMLIRIKENNNTNDLLVYIIKNIASFFQNGTPCIGVKEKNSKYVKDFIVIPSYYKIIQTCAEELGYSKGRRIIINNGWLENDSKKIKKAIPIEYTYTRMEPLNLTKDFKYTGHNLTGIIDQDYYELKCYENQEYNISEIIHNSDINLKKDGIKYRILNGRHRLLYLLNQTDYSTGITIPVNIEKTIGDEEYQERLLEIKPDELYKTDLNNDDVEVIITIKNKVYLINNIKELRNFLNNPKKYFLYNQKNVSKIPNILYTLYKQIGNKITDYNFLDLLKYIMINGVHTSEKTYSIEEINLNSLYVEYTILNHCINQKRILKENISLSNDIPIFKLLKKEN